MINPTMFRVELVMTASIRLHIFYIAIASVNLKIRWKSVRIVVRKNRSYSKQELKKSVFKPLLR